MILLEEPVSLEGETSFQLIQDQFIDVLICCRRAAAQRDAELPSPQRVGQLATRRAARCRLQGPHGRVCRVCYATF